MDYFAVEHLCVERLLKDWRWLCPQSVSLVARNVYGDLFLRDNHDKVLRLDVAIGRLTQVADSLQQFLSRADSEEMREEWFAVVDEQQATSRGLIPGPEQCIGFSTPLVFKESGHPVNPYIADIYDQVGFLGDLHRQISELPEGAKVRLVVKE